MAENNPDEPGLKDFRKVFINPIILETSGDKWGFEEGCLSLPHIHEEVHRPEKVRIEYFDEQWNLLEEEYEGTVESQPHTLLSNAD
jgi:peptide deformylase